MSELEYKNYDQLSFVLYEISELLTECYDAILPEVYDDVVLGMKYNLYMEEYKKVRSVMDRIRDGVDTDIDRFTERFTKVKISIKELRQRAKYLRGKLDEELQDNNSDYAEEIEQIIQKK